MRHDRCLTAILPLSRIGWVCPRLHNRDASWKWERIATCGASGAQALITAFGDARLMTDTIFLRDLYRASSALRSAGLLQASLQLAEDAGATVPARVTALLTVASQSQMFLAPGDRSFGNLTRVPVGNYCLMTTPMGVDYLNDLGVTVADLQGAAVRTAVLARSASASVVVRELARCVSRYVSFDAPPPIDPDDITIDYVCGTRYRVRNSSLRLVVVA